MKQNRGVMATLQGSKNFRLPPVKEEISILTPVFRRHFQTFLYFVAKLYRAVALQCFSLLSRHWQIYWDSLVKLIEMQLYIIYIQRRILYPEKNYKVNDIAKVKIILKILIEIFKICNLNTPRIPTSFHFYSI